MSAYNKLQESLDPSPVPRLDIAGIKKLHPSNIHPSNEQLRRTGYEFDATKTADLEEAKLHGEGKLFPLNTSSFALAELGVGIPLFFKFTKSILYLLTVLLLIAGIPCLYGNLSQDNLDEWNEDPHLIVRTSLGAYGKSNDGVFWQTILHIIAGVSFYFLYVVIIYVMKNTARDADVFVISPSDFALKIDYLPKNYDKEEIKKHFASFSKSFNKEVTVVDVIPVYDIRPLVKVNNKVNDLKAKRSYINSRIETGLTPEQARKHKFLHFFSRKYPTIEQLDVKILKIVLKQSKLIHERDAKHATSTAFVILQSMLNTRRIAELMDHDIINRIRQILSNCTRKDKTHNYLSKIRIGKAPEPDDIYWINMNVNSIKRFMIEVGIYIILIIALGFSLILLYQINSYQEDNHSRIITISLSVFVMFYNLVLSYLIQILTKFEMHSTWSDYASSLTNKLCLFLCVNTVYLPLYIHGDSNDWYKDSGLAEDIFWLAVINAIVPNFIYAVDLPYLIRVLRRKFLERKAAKNIPLKMSQADANRLYEGPELDLSHRSAQIVKTYMLCVSYSPLLPIVIPICMAGLIIEHWICKYKLLRIHKKPRNYGNEIFKNVSLWISLGIFVHSIMIFYFYREIQADWIMYTLFYSWLSFQFLFLPTKSLVNKYRNRTSYELLSDLYRDDPDADNYEKQLTMFTTDYLRANPVTEDEGWLKWLGSYFAQESDEERKSRIKNIIEGVSSRNEEEKLNQWTRYYRAPPSLHRNIHRPYSEQINEYLYYGAPTSRNQTEGRPST